MRRKLALIIVILSSFFCNSQDYGYLVETEITGSLHANHGQLSIGSYVGAIDLGLTDYFATNVGDIYYDYFSISNSFENIHITVENEAEPLNNFPLCEYTDSFNTSKNNFNTDNYIYFNGCSFKQRVYPLHIEEPDASSSTLCLIDEITLQHGYNWQYSYDGAAWVDFPTNLNTPVTTFVLSDLLGQTTENQVKFRTGYNGNYTNIVTYSIIPCSPQLTSFTPTDTQCSYSSDGSFTANFDRDLNTGETLIMTLYEIDGGGNEILINQQSTTTLETGNIYQWPLPQPGGTYLIKYQTENGGVYSSLEASGQFIINNPPPVSFSGTKQNDVYCFGGIDGVIQLNASGGAGSFQYQINSGSWVSFSNTNTHIITSLPQGNYNIKIQDANGCTEQN